MHQMKKPNFFGGWIFLLLLLPLIELWGLIQVGSLIGALNTILLVILTGVLGIYLTRQEGLQAVRKVQENMMRGEPPGDAILDGLCILAGGILLLIPGFFTDLLGTIFLIPFTRNWIKRWIIIWIRKKMEQHYR
ncbi:FxsA family protein [Thermoflavimicrobium daqui]